MAVVQAKPVVEDLVQAKPVMGNLAQAWPVSVDSAKQRVESSLLGLENESAWD